MKKTCYTSRLSQVCIREPIPCERDRILIVDDEKLVRDVFRRIVSFNIPDSRIDMATNGAEALENFRIIHQSVIVMDLMMPVMDGEAAFYQIKSVCEVNNWEMPSIVFCTGYIPSDSVRKIIKMYPNHCLLQKPVKNEILIKTIKLRLAA